MAYLNGRVVRLAGGLACPNCNHTLRAIDTVIDNVDLTLRVGIVTSTSCASRAGSSFRTQQNQKLKSSSTKETENQNV